MTSGKQAIIVNLTMLSLAWIAVTLRCISRFILLRRGGVDDILCIGSMLACTVMSAMNFQQYRYGLGYPLRSLPAPEVLQFRKFMWVSVLAYASGTMLCKDSAICQFLRFIRVGWLNKVCWGMLSFITVFGVIGTVSSIFSCSPIPYAWDRSIANGSCKSPAALWLLGAGLVIATDIICVAIPVAAFKDLNLPRRQKFALILVFALGGIACLTAALRVEAVLALVTSKDVTKHNATSATWSSLELNIGIICISIPTLKPVVHRLMPRFLHEDEDTYQNNLGKSAVRRLSHSAATSYDEMEFITIADMGKSEEQDQHQNEKKEFTYGR